MRFEFHPEALAEYESTKMPRTIMQNARKGWSCGSLQLWNMPSSRLLKRLNVGRFSKMIFADALPASFRMLCFTRLKLITC